MFRFLHTADLHLDSPLRGLAAREEVEAQTLLGASRRAFQNLIDLALTEQVDFLIIAGDVYDGDWKDYGTGLFFQRGMTQLQRANIPVFLISGNHDAASVVTRSLTLPETVHTFSSRSPSTVEPDRWPVAIHGMSFPNRAVDENLVPKYPVPIAGKFNIGLLHTSLAGRAGHDTYAPCSIDDLVEKGYDYWALGHIHQPEIVLDDPWIVYPGNIQGRHIRETGPRGCRIVTVDDSLVVSSCTWHPLDVARWASVLVDASGVEAFDTLLTRVRESIDSAFDAAEGRLLALRIVITGVTSLHGSLLSDPDYTTAEVQALLGSYGSDAIWLETIRLETRPLVDLEVLAESDELTRIVLEAEVDDSTDLTSIVEASGLIKALPNSLRSEMQKMWTGQAIVSLYADARSIILDRLRSTGGDS